MVEKRDHLPDFTVRHDLAPCRHGRPAHAASDDVKVQHWTQETEDNDRPLTEVEMERMKAFLKQNAPTSYFEIFPEELLIGERNNGKDLHSKREVGKI